MIPMSFFEFCIANVNKEFKTKRYGFTIDPYQDIDDKEEAFRVRKLRKSLKMLELNDKNIWLREQSRDHIECPRLMLMVYYTICYILDFVFKDKPIDRFWFLETVARMPYFSYVAILHMYETLGWWELDSELKKNHYKEEENEMYHLKIMESLGGTPNGGTGSWPDTVRWLTTVFCSFSLWCLHALRIYRANFLKCTL